MKILLLEAIHEEAVSLLSGFGDVRRSEQNDPVAILAEFASADAVLTRGTGRIPGEALRAGKNLKCVARCGAGTDNIDVATATELGIPVLYSPDGTTWSVAEHAVMLMLAVGRRLVFLDRETRKNNWQIRNHIGIGTELRGKTLGILGLGKIGARTAELGAAFGMDVIYWSRSSRDDRFRAVELEDLFRQSDFLSISLSLNAETRGFVNAERIGWMKPSAVLINTARGEMVDEDALVAALAERRIAGAGLDVLAQEPPPVDHPLFRFDNVAFTPHIGTITDQAYRTMCVEVAAEVLKVLAGKSPAMKYVRNPAVYAQEKVSYKES